MGALVAGLLGALAIAPPPGAALAGVGASCAAAAIALRARRAVPALAALAIALALGGWAFGAARLAATAPPALALPAAVGGTVVVDTPPVRDRRGGVRARALAERLRAGSGGPVPAGARLLLDVSRRPGPPIGLGDRLRVVGRLLPAADPRDPAWWRAYVERQGIAARLRVGTMAGLGRRGGLRGLRDRWRRWAGGAAGAGLTGDRAALVRGMALGGGAGLSAEAAQAFRDAGLWHLLAVSGQNVAVVALAALAALRALGAGRRPAVAMAGLLLVAYCLACDGGASVARAGVVGALGALAELRSAGRDRWHLLLVGLAALLAAQPRSIGDPGLQLSFAAVVGLFAIAPALEGPLRGFLPRPAAALAALAAGAGLATAPVLVWSFGRLSLAGLALNVVAVPLAGPVVVVALCGVVAGALLPVAGVALAWAAGLGAGLLLVMARVAAAIPGAAVELPSPAALPLVALAAAPPLVARWLRRAPRRPGRRSHAPYRRAGRRTLAIGALAAIAAVALGWPRDGGPGWPATPALTVLDVGQGQAVLLRAPDGSAALIDAGPPGDPAPVLAALRREGVRRLSAVALTHGSLDHAGGAAAVLERLPVGALVRPPLPDLPRAVREALAAARARGTPVRTLAAGDELTVGPWRLRAFSPAARPSASADPNRASLVLLAVAGPLAALLPGDAEGDVLSGLPIPPVDVLVVSHHGSDDPALPALLRRLRPAAALISVGARNAYGHPAPATLEALRAAGVRVLRTDRAGDLTVSASNRGRAVHSQRSDSRITIAR